MSLALESQPASKPPIVRARRYRLRAWPSLLVVGWCGLLFFYGLGRGQLYQTEGLRALVAVECLRGGSFWVPRLYGEPLLTKPPGMYLAIALASWPAGEVTPITARLPSALAASVTVLLFYWTFARLLGRGAGLVAASVLPATVLWLNRVPSAEIDMLQLAWVSAALLCWLRALEITEENGAGWRQWLWWQAALLCVAGGLMTKWTAPAFFYLTAIPMLAWRGRLRSLWHWPHLLSLVVAGLPCLAWGLAVVHQVGWPVLRDTVAREALQHLSPAHHSRAYPWWEIVTFPLGFLASMMPWSAVALLGLRPSFARLWDERTRRLWQLLLCWTWANLLFWSLVPGHRPRHSLPLQPGLASLAALVWIAWLRGRLRWPTPRIRPGSVLVGLLLCWVVVKLVFVHHVIARRDSRHHPRAGGRDLAAAVPSAQVLYLLQLKDECTLFYYGRPARRLARLEDLPRGGEAVYCALTEAEWRRWPSTRPATLVLRLHDSQGSPFVLVRTH